jgi:hypothetical protein
MISINCGGTSSARHISTRTGMPQNLIIGLLSPVEGDDWIDTKSSYPEEDHI